MRFSFRVSLVSATAGIATVLFSGLLAASPAHAQNLIVNGSFEDGAFVNQQSGFMVLSPGSTTMTGWTVFNADLAWGDTPNGTGLVTPFGIKFLDFTAFDNAVPHGGVQQNIPTAPGTSYLASFFLGTLETGFPNHQGPITVEASAAGVTQQFTFDPPPGSEGNQWGQFFLPFTATGATTTVSFLGIFGDQHIGMDNVSVVAVSSAAAPEPASAALLLAGASLLVARRRRSRSAVDPTPGRCKVPHPEGTRRFKSAYPQVCGGADWQAQIDSFAPPRF
jgi:hypothetical protein